MNVKNYFDAERTELPNCQGGDGTLYCSDFFAGEAPGAFDFVRCLVLPSGTSIGSHVHEGTDELYVVLSGEGVYEENGERTAVATGDLVVLRSGGSHALYNTSVFDLRLLAVQAKIK